LLALLVAAGSAHAYVGPGAGLDLIGYTISLAACGLAAFSSVLLWPIYTLLRKLRAGRNKPAQASPVEPEAQQAPADCKANE
jgi:hypothetical protein